MLRVTAAVRAAFPVRKMAFQVSQRQYLTRLSRDFSGLPRSDPGMACNISPDADLRRLDEKPVTTANFNKPVRAALPARKMGFQIPQREYSIGLFRAEFVLHWRPKGIR